MKTLKDYLAETIRRYGAVGSSPGMGYTLESSKQVDMKDKKCTACKKGTYQETGPHDDMDGVLHCNRCNREVKRHQSAASKKKRVSEGIMDVVKQTFNDCVAGYPQGTSEGQFLQGWARAIRAETGRDIPPEKLTRLYHDYTERSPEIMQSHGTMDEDSYKDTRGTFKDRLVGEILNFYTTHGRIPRVSEYSRAVRSKLNSLDYDERSKLHRQANVKALKLAGKQGNLSKLGLDEGEGMSRAAKGYEKYGREGMQALARAGREGRALDPVRDRYDRYDEGVEEGGEFPSALWVRSNMNITNDQAHLLLYNFAKKIAAQHGLQDKIQKIYSLAQQAAISSEDHTAAGAKFKQLLKKYLDQGVSEGSTGEELEAIDGDYYEDSTDFFSMFDQDHFDREEESDDGMEIRGYIDDKCVMVFKFSTPDMMGGWGNYDDSALMAEAAVEDDEETYLGDPSCPECDGAGCPECYGDEDRDRAHDHAQGTQRESTGMAEAGRPDVMRHRGDTTVKVVKKAGKPIGEIGIDAEASEGNGSYYVKLYDGSYDASGFDTAAEALAELKAAISEGITETAAVKYGVFAKGGSVGSQRFRDDPLKTFDTKEEAVADARRRRSSLSPGERGYYRMGYVVKPIKSEVDEGMIDSIKNTVRAANYDRLARRSNSQAVAGGGFAPPAQFKSLSAKGDQRAQKAQDIRKGSAEQVDEIDMGLVGDAVAGAAMGLGSVGLGSYIGHKIGNKIGQKFIDRDKRKEAAGRKPAEAGSEKMQAIEKARAARIAANKAYRDHENLHGYELAQDHPEYQNRVNLGNKKFRNMDVPSAFDEDAASNDPLLSKAVDLAPVGALEENAELRLILQRAKLIE